MDHDQDHSSIPGRTPAPDARQRRPAAPRHAPEEVEHLARLFAGSERWHGTHGEPVRDEAKNKWVIRSTAKTLPGPATIELWLKHLRGTTPLGVVPLMGENEDHCAWGSADIDDYTVDNIALIKKIEAAKYPLIMVRSKSGGVHLFLFLREPELASVVRKTLHDLVAALDLEKAPEIFPKQDRLVNDGDRDDRGSWICMPYFGGTYDGKLKNQHGIRSSGSEMELDEFLDAAEAALTTTAELRALLRVHKAPKAKRAGGMHDETGVPFGDGPPCLQKLAANKVPVGSQDPALFMMGIYAKRAHPDDWERHVEDYNRLHLQQPGSAEYVVGKIKSLRKKDYLYTCKIEPMCGECDAALCRRRTFGVGVGTGNGKGSNGGGDYPVIAGVTKFVSDDPEWRVRLDGFEHELTFVKEQDITNYGKFNDRCFKMLNCYFDPMKQADWAPLLRDAMSRVVEIALPPDQTRDGQFMNLLTTYLADRAHSRSWHELATGKPFEDKEGEHGSRMRGAWYIRLERLAEFLRREAEFPENNRQIGERLKKLGGGRYSPSGDPEKASATTISGRSVRLWWLPPGVVEHMEPLPLPPPRETVI